MDPIYYCAAVLSTLEFVTRNPQNTTLFASQQLAYSLIIDPQTFGGVPHCCGIFIVGFVSIIQGEG
jgi:hypothetical protein